MSQHKPAPPSSSPTARGNIAAKSVRTDLRSSFHDAKLHRILVAIMLLVGSCAMFVHMVHSLSSAKQSFEYYHGILLILIIICLVIGWLTTYSFERVVIRWDCHHCGKRLESDTDWTCGGCDRNNESESFLNRCEYCHAVPKAFECYHCGESTFFVNGDLDNRTQARKITVPRPGESVDEARRREIEERQHEKRRLELDIELAALRAKLNPPKPEKIDPFQKRQEWLTKQMEMAALDCRTISHCATWKENLIRQIKDDPNYSAEAAETSIDVIERYFEAIEQRILNGDIPLA